MIEIICAGIMIVVLFYGILKFHSMNNLSEIKRKEYTIEQKRLMDDFENKMTEYKELKKDGKI